MAGEYPDTFQCAQVDVFHTQTVMETGATVNGQLIEPFTGPSGNAFILQSVLFAGMSAPPLLNLHLLEGNQELYFEGIDPQVIDDYFRYPYPITQYGPHVWTNGTFTPPPGATWSDGTPITPDDLAFAWAAVGRSIGTAGITVDEQEGTINNLFCTDAVWPGP
jgi:ABC-type transport system substrate-binding protein